MTLVIAAFPGTGKTHFNQHSGLKTFDLNSGKFARTKNGDRPPHFPDNYIAHIKEHLGEADYVFIPTYKEVCDALSQAGIDYTLIFPKRSLKKEYMERYRKRGSSEDFIELSFQNWDVWLSENEEQQGCKKVVLQEGQYLSDVL